MEARAQSSDEVKRAREAAKQSLGSALAEKASDELCIALASPAVQMAQGVAFRGVGFEAAAAPAPETPAVIELQAPEPEAEEASPRPESSAEAVTEALEGLGEHAAWAEDALATAARQAAIRVERDRFYHQLGGIRDQVERGAATLATSNVERPRIGVAAAAVQACWLNNTIRAEAHAAVLGEVAEHAAVERIDLPRRLESEVVDVTIADAASFRSEAGLSGAGVLVGVIDSEVQQDHPALVGRVVHRRNYTQEPFGTPGAHGTTVAGLIAADAPGFTGMAPVAQVYNYKILATQRALHSTDFEGALAIQHALEDGVRVVNCSWTSGAVPDGTSREAKACDEAWRLGLVIVKSAGNSGPGPSTLTTPADAEGVFVVGSTGADGTAIADYSSRGPALNSRKRPHVVAPGGIEGTEIDGIMVGGAVGTLPFQFVGTSFAAPHVAGLVALLLEREPALAPDAVRDKIVATCRQLPGVSADEQGAGLVTPSAL